LILKQYIGRELIKTTLAVTSVLCLVFLCHQLIRLLAKVAAGKLSTAMLMNILFLQLPYLLGLLLPIGVYFAVILVFSRMYVDHEMTIYSTCGLSRWQILAMVLPSTLWMMLLVAALTLGLNPQLLAVQAKLLQQSPTRLLADTLIPGRFHIVNGGKQVYYVESIDRESDTAHKVFLARREANTEDPSKSQGARWSVLSAATGKRYQDSNGIDYIVAEYGNRYLGQAGQAEFQWTQFTSLASFLQSATTSPLLFTYASMSSRSLWQLRKKDLLAAAELQWRIIVPLSVPVLALLALPLSYVRPRHGRYSSLIPAILIYIIFANAMFISRRYLESGRLSPTIGLWGVILFTSVFASILQTDWRAVWTRQRSYLEKKGICA